MHRKAVKFPKQRRAKRESADPQMLRKVLGEWGTVSENVLSPIINPAFCGGPQWPGLRQSWSVARCKGRTLLTSDGLSDAFLPGEGPENVNGLGLELFAIAPEDELGGRSGTGVAGTWLWDLVHNMSQFAAGHKGIAPLVAEMGVISTELPDVRIPPEFAPRFVDPSSGRVCVLLGLTEYMTESGNVPLPSVYDGGLSPVMLVNVKLLTLEELQVIRSGGAGARRKMVDHIRTQGNVLVSSLNRPSAAGPQQQQPSDPQN